MQKRPLLSVQWTLITTYWKPLLWLISIWYRTGLIKTGISVWQSITIIIQFTSIGRNHSSSRGVVGSATYFIDTLWKVRISFTVAFATSTSLNTRYPLTNSSVKILPTISQITDTVKWHLITINRSCKIDLNYDTEFHCSHLSIFHLSAHQFPFILNLIQRLMDTTLR